MIGRLLQSAASTFTPQASSRPQPPLESVTEETHTRELLYPEIQSLRASFNDLALGTARASTARDAVNYDDRGALDISYPGDVRIIIAQDAHSRHHQPQILYDSRPAHTTPSNSPSDTGSAQRAPLRLNKSVTSPTTTTPRHRHTPSGPFFSALSPTSPRSPGEKNRFNFGDARARTSSYEPGSADGETAQGKLAREAKEDVDALLGCMFGAPGFRLEPGTKLHILPRRVSDGEAYGGKKGSSGARPISSGGFQRKRTPLVRSTSAADVHGRGAASGTDGSDARPGGTKPSIMFTRLFTVNIPDFTSTETDETGSPAKTAPAASETQTKEPASTQVKQKKVPMYAVAVILHLPTESSHRPRPAHSPQGLSPLGSSLNDSTPPTSWRGEHSAFASFMEIRSHGPFDTVLNSHIPHVLQHWNIINRILELLENCSGNKLSTLLEQVDPPPQLTPNPSPKPGTGKIKKPKPQNQQSVYVMPGCLHSDERVLNGIESASRRIISALRTRRVVIGQGRWGAWREEARWVGRWAGGKEQNFFLYNCLTAFLGTHTEWLELLAPKWYRKRYAVKQRIHGGDNPAILPQRTVIVSSDKMAARRLIFLLASLLPSHLNHYQVAVSTRERESHPVSYSESPPQFTSNRDNGPRRSATQKSSLGRKSGNEVSGHIRSVSFSLTGDANEEVIVGDVHRSRARRDSDVRSLRNSSLVATGDTGSRKASMSTVTADTVQAIPHFSNLSYDEPSSPVAERKRPGSGGSVASFVLSSTLKRSESTTGSTSGSGGRWGSVVSGFWSNRMDSSTDDSDVFVSSQESPRKTNFSRHEHRRSGSGLDRMVEEADVLRHSPVQPSLLSGSPRRPLQLDDCLKPRHPALQESGSAARNIPRPRKPERLPLKLSFNEDEGYLDIAMDKEHSFSSSLASSFASIRHPLAAPFPTTAHEHISPYGSIASDSPQTYPRAEPALDVAGWLKFYQPDFVLQAVRAYDALVSDVKAAMEHESSLVPPSADEQSAGNEWTEISTTLIADATRFTVERIRLLRRARSTSTPRSPKSPTSHAPKDAYEIRHVTEPIMDLDPMLSDAVERILAVSLSAPSSRASSPPRNATGPRPVPITAANATQHDGGMLSETPHAECRRAILGALEGVARSVAAERERYHMHQRRKEGRNGNESGNDEAVEGVQDQGSELDAEAAGNESDEREKTASACPTTLNIGREPGREGIDAGVADGDGTLREGVRKWMRDVEAAW